MQLRKGDKLVNLNSFFYDKIKKASRKTNKLIIFEEFIVLDRIIKLKDKKIIEKIEDEENKETKRFIKECLKRKIMLFSMTEILRKHFDEELKQNIKEFLEILEKGETVDLQQILHHFGNIFIYALICIDDKNKQIENVLDFIINDNNF